MWDSRRRSQWWSPGLVVSRAPPRGWWQISIGAPSSGTSVSRWRWHKITHGDASDRLPSLDRAACFVGTGCVPRLSLPSELGCSDHLPIGEDAEGPNDRAGLSGASVTVRS